MKTASKTSTNFNVENPELHFHFKIISHIYQKFELQLLVVIWIVRTKLTTWRPVKN